MISIFKYTKTVPIFRNVSNEGLGNTDAMFNDTITLHRNMDNTINFKLTDRDRRTVQFENKNICVRIVDDETHLVADTFYLSPTQTPKVLSATLPSAFVNQLDPRLGYSFFVAIESPDGSLEPLYIDHDFHMSGNVTVLDNYSEVVQDKHDGYHQRTDNFEDDIRGEYCLSTFINVDVNFRQLDFKTYDSQSSEPVSIKIQKHHGKYFPISTEDDSQWREFLEVKNVHTHSWSHVELPEGKYRAVLTTETPEQYFFVEHTVNRL